MGRKKKPLMNSKRLMMPKKLLIKLQLMQLNRKNMMRKWKIVLKIMVKKMKEKVKKRKRKILTQEKIRKDTVTNAGLLEKSRKLMLKSTKMVLMKLLMNHFSMKISTDLGILLLKHSLLIRIQKLQKKKDSNLTRKVRNIQMNLLDLLVFAQNANKLKKN